MTIHSNLLLFPTMRFTSFFSAVGFFISRDHCDVRQAQLYIASRYQACHERLWLGHKAILPGIWPDIRFRLFRIGPKEVVIMGGYKELQVPDIVCPCWQRDGMMRHSSAHPAIGPQSIGFARWVFRLYNCYGLCGWIVSILRPYTWRRI